MSRRNRRDPRHVSVGVATATALMTRDRLLGAGVSAASLWGDNEVHGGARRGLFAAGPVTLEGRNGPSSDAAPAPTAVVEATDETLAVRSRTDAEAFAVLYDRYCEAIHRYVHRRLGSREQAEDVTAEVFFKALRAIDSYRPDGAPFSAWLYRIAANCVVDHVRARRPTVSLDVVADAADPAAAVADQVAQRAEVEQVWAAVQTLNDAQRTAVTLRLGHDLSIAEIAVRLERSEGAVKLLLNRGLRAVRARLDPGSGPDPGQPSGPPEDRGAGT